jgi:hypothetical protein
VNYITTRPQLGITNLETDCDLYVTENYNIINFVNQGHSHGALLFSTTALHHIKLLCKGMSPLCNIDKKVGP